ncbi:hypothetical protein PISMIDRAFT_493412 [Pisolithus microcarpus 441]|uniref:Unplaced genomic scaffold scaffold_52, whole genome shotgun sequence n=1 Tax=Pisolithus microcarpus 441 TaxID=765257 RepID=A0A0C9ZJQ9_9AGAM|nr:hypothetical protein PISMIDRAFT_493412 [Pisolithus microcarpus 441]
MLWSLDHRSRSRPGMLRNPCLRELPILQLTQKHYSARYLTSGLRCLSIPTRSVINQLFLQILKSASAFGCLRCDVLGFFT